LRGIKVPRLTLKCADFRLTTSITRLLAGVVKAIASVRYCWLVTAGEDGSQHSRPMGLLRHEPVEDPWRLLFLTDRRSPKAADIRRDRRVRLIINHDPDNWKPMVEIDILPTQ
jgi:general stress protein 26